jgi:hypothetical protein
VDPHFRRHERWPALTRCDLSPGGRAELGSGVPSLMSGPSSAWRCRVASRRSLVTEQQAGSLCSIPGDGLFDLLWVSMVRWARRLRRLDDLTSGIRAEFPGPTIAVLSKSVMSERATPDKDKPRARGEDGDPSGPCTAMPITGPAVLVESWVTTTCRPRYNTVKLERDGGVAGLLLGLWPPGVVGAFDVPLGHLAFDDAWRRPPSSCRVEAGDQSAQEGQPETIFGAVSRGEKRPGAPRTGG